MKRKICVITGTRAEYGILNPVMSAINASNELSLHVIATGMHLMPEFGYTIDGIKQDGFKIYEEIDISYKEDSGQAIAFSVGKAISSFSLSFERLAPDFVVVLGDRGEMLAAAIAANYLNIPVAHIHGGEISGHIDGQLRHAITKLSHFHFPATKKAKERILRLGEEGWRICVAGAPALDRILYEQLPDKDQLLAKYSLDPCQPFVILVQHPVLTETGLAAKQIRATLQAITELGIQTIVVFPNADAGGREMIKVIKEYQSKPFIRAYKNIPHLDYLGLMKSAAVLAGNSSSGIIESSSYKLPVINIGNRQQGRERDLNVIDAPHEKKAIIRAIKKALNNKRFRARLKKCHNHYGDGRASERIVKALSSIKLDLRLLQKQITY